MVMLVTVLQKLEPELLHALNEIMVVVRGVTVIDAVVCPPGLQVYEVGLLVHVGVNVTGVPGATGAAAVAAGETLIVHTGGMPNADPQINNRIANARAFAICQQPTKSHGLDLIST